MKKAEKAIFALPSANDETKRISSTAFWFTVLSMRIIYETELVAMTKRLKESTNLICGKLSAVDQEDIKKIINNYTQDLEDKINAGMKATDEIKKDKESLTQPNSVPHNPDNNERVKDTLYNRLKKLTTRQERNEDKLEEARKAYMKAEVKAEDAKRTDKKEPEAVKKAVALERKALKALGKYKECNEMEQDGRMAFLNGNRDARYEWIAKTQSGIEKVVKTLVSFFGNLNTKENPDELRHHHSIGNIRYDEILDILENFNARNMTRKLACHFREVREFPVFEEYCPNDFQTPVTEFSDEDDDVTERRAVNKEMDHDTEYATPDVDSIRDVTLMSEVYVLATEDFKRKNKKELSLKAGMKIKQKKPANEDGFAYGWTRSNNIVPKKYGFYPAKCVTWYKSAPHKKDNKSEH